MEQNSRGIGPAQKVVLPAGVVVNFLCLQLTCHTQESADCSRTAL